jgi:hypothetical protein
MKRVSVIAALLFLPACASSAGSVVQIDTGANAQSTWLTDMPGEQIARCLGRAFATSPQQSEQGWSITDNVSTTTYRVSPVSDPLNRYTTIVEQIGLTSTERPVRVSECLVATR